MNYFLGLDLGQRRDHSAIVIVEKVSQVRAYQGLKLGALLVRYLERVPLGTSYAQVVARVGRIVKHQALRGNCGIAVDSTGVGSPVVEMLRQAQLGCDVAAVTMTGGEREARNAQGWNVPKRDLLAGVQVLLERGELRIAAKMPHVRTLMKELMEVRGVTRENGTVRMGADGYGEHDDLVIALALACWRARRGVVGVMPGRLF